MMDFPKKKSFQTKKIPKSTPSVTASRASSLKEGASEGVFSYVEVLHQWINCEQKSLQTRIQNRDG
jgi:hypothetical protein